MCTWLLESYARSRTTGGQLKELPFFSLGCWESFVAAILSRNPKLKIVRIDFL